MVSGNKPTDYSGCKTYDDCKKKESCCIGLNSMFDRLETYCGDADECRGIYSKYPSDKWWLVVLIVWAVLCVIMICVKRCKAKKSRKKHPFHSNIK